MHLQPQQKLRGCIKLCSGDLCLHMQTICATTSTTSFLCQKRRAQGAVIQLVRDRTLSQSNHTYQPDSITDGNS